MTDEELRTRVGQTGMCSFTNIHKEQKEYADQ